MPRRNGFTLVELLVVIAIIGVMVALLLPAVQMAREAARRTKCANHIKQLVTAVQMFHDAHQGLPPQGTYTAGATFSGYSIHARILPFVEQANLHNLVNYDVGYAAQPDVCKLKIPLYRCPSDAREGLRDDGGVTFYGTNYGFNI